MEYIEMSIEDAIKYSKGNKSRTVLVSIQDLEREEEVVEFVKATKKECENIIRSAETVTRAYDDFINQLRVFTVKQVDIHSITPKGKLNTILLRE